MLFPALLGWKFNQSFFLAFIVGLHVGTAVALLVYYRQTWKDLFLGTWSQVQRSRHDGLGSLIRLNDNSINRHYRQMALLVMGTIPVAVVALVAQKHLRALFAKPEAAALFLFLNGLILLGSELLRRRRGRHAVTVTLDSVSPRRALAVGSAQILALFAGISRSGVTMSTGLWFGFSYEEAANFSFLLATPVILLAGLADLPKLMGPAGDGIRLQSLVGAIVAGVAAYLAVRFLAKWFTTKTLWPFAMYCLVVGGACAIRFASLS